MLALDDALIDLGAPGHVVRLDGEHFLQGVSRAVGFQRPHFHLAEALTAELCLAAQRLLGHQAVRSGGARMHLVIHQMVQFQNVLVTHRHLAIKCLAGATVVQRGLARQRQIGQFQHVLDLFFAGAVEYRRRKRHTMLQVAAQLDDFIIRERVEINALTVVMVVDLVEELAHLGDFGVGLQHLVDLLAQALGCPAQVSFENLADVHPRRHAERIQHHIDRRAIRHVGHVFHRHDARHHTLVTVTTGHLVAGLQATLHRDIHLDHLLHAGLQLVALGQFFLLQLERGVEFGTLLRQTFLDLLHLGSHFIVGDANIEPLMRLDAMQIVAAQLGALGQLLRSAVGHFVVQQLFHTRKHVGLHDAHLIHQILFVAIQFVIDDLLGALVALQSLAREHLHVDHRSRAAGRHTQAGVFDVRSLLAENRAQQFLFRCQLGLAFGRHLADQHVADCDFRADMHDAAFVQTRQLRFGQIRNIAGDFLRAKLGIACGDGQLFDMDRGKAILRRNALGDQNRVLVVVTVPRHERDQHVLAERQFAHIGGSAVRHHVAA